MRKSRKKLILKLVLTAMVIAIALFGMSRLYGNRIGELQNELAQANDRLSEYEAATVRVVCAAEDIAAGSTIDEDSLMTVEVPAEAVPADVCMSKSSARGIARIDISRGTYLTEMMLADACPDSDIREVEFSGIHTAGHIGAGSCVDIRILFPDGTDYVIMSQKLVFSMGENGNGLVLHVNEEELLLMDSAQVDAYLYEGTCLYATAYVERELQKAAVVNYTPSEQSAKLIAQDPNITMIASQYLASTEREKLERRMVGR